MDNIFTQAFHSLGLGFDLLFSGVFSFLPKLAFTLIFLSIGVWLARLVYSWVSEVLAYVKFDRAFAYLGFKSFFDEVGLHFSISRVLSWLAHFGVMFVFVMASLNVMGLTGVGDYIQYGLLEFVPQLLTVALILFITFSIASKLKDITLHTTIVVKGFSPLIGNVVWFFTVLLGVFTALEFLNISSFVVEMVTLLTQALAIGGALALGLAFGLGCKEEARCIVRGWMGKDCDDLDCGCYSDDELVGCCDCDCGDCDSGCGCECCEDEKRVS